MQSLYPHYYNIQPVTVYKSFKNTTGKILSIVLQSTDSIHKFQTW